MRIGQSTNKEKGLRSSKNKVIFYGNDFDNCL